MKKIALVLSGGGARGIAHVGVIEELLEQGYEITSVAGTSMGAVVGAYYAMEKLKELKEFLLTVDKRKIFQLLDFNIGAPGLVKGEKLIRTLQEFAPDMLIENTKIPFTAIATDIVNKKEVVFKSGSIYSAIRASIAIPTFFTPVKTKNGLLVDGGVLNNIPINHVFKAKGVEVFAVDVNADVPVLNLNKTKKEQEQNKSVYTQKLKQFNEQIHKLIPIGFKEQMGYFKLIESTIALMTHRMTLLQLKMNEPDELINISHETCNMFDFFMAENLIEIGRLATKNKLNKE